jgi:hypothetical protein
MQTLLAVTAARESPTSAARGPSSKALAPSSAVSWLPIPSRSAIAVFVASSAAIRKIRAVSAGAQLPQAHPVPRPIKLSQPPPCHAIAAAIMSGNKMLRI